MLLAAVGCTSRLDVAGTADGDDTGTEADAGSTVGEADEGGDDYSDDWGGPSCRYSYLDLCAPPNEMECGDEFVDASLGELCDDGLRFGSFDGCTNSCRYGPAIVDSHYRSASVSDRLTSTALVGSSDGSEYYDGLQLETPLGIDGHTWSTRLVGPTSTPVEDMALRAIFDDDALYFAHEQSLDDFNQRVEYRIDDGTTVGNGAFEMPSPLRVDEACTWRHGRVDLRVGVFAAEDTAGAVAEVAAAVGFEVIDGADGTANSEVLFVPAPGTTTPVLDCAQLSTGDLAYIWHDDGTQSLRVQNGAVFSGTTVTSSGPVVPPSIVALDDGSAAWLWTLGSDPILAVGDPNSGSHTAAALPSAGVSWAKVERIGSGILAVRGLDASSDEVVWRAYDQQADGMFEFRMPFDPLEPAVAVQRVGEDAIAWLSGTQLTITDLTGQPIFTVDLATELGLRELRSLGDGRVVVWGASDDHLSVAVVDPGAEAVDFEIHEFETDAQVTLERILVVDETHIAVSAVVAPPSADAHYYWSALVEFRAD